jgi:uncharacterized protein YoxC
MRAVDIAALVAAGTFFLLVLLLAYPLIRLGRTLDQASLAIRGTHDRAAPLLAQAQNAMDTVTLGLNEIDDITTQVNSITANLAELTAVVSMSITGPLIKVSALAYGVRAALARRRPVNSRTTQRPMAMDRPLAAQRLATERATATERPHAAERLATERPHAAERLATERPHAAERLATERRPMMNGAPHTLGRAG